MDFQTFHQAFESASLFELYRLDVLLRKHLDDPERLQAIRDRLRPGQQVRYFDDQENREIMAEVLELRQTRVLIRRMDDHKTWVIPLYWLNLDGINTDLPTQNTGLKRSNLKVGDEVGFYDRQNREVYGIVQRLNTKTVTLLTKDGASWRVAYHLLFPVLHSQQSTGVIRILPPEL